MELFFFPIFVFAIRAVDHLFGTTAGQFGPEAIRLINVFASALGLALALHKSWVRPLGFVVSAVAIVLNVILADYSGLQWVGESVTTAILIILWDMSIWAGVLLHAISLIQLWRWRNIVEASHVSRSFSSWRP
jgi:hypothetical protein